MEISYQKFGDEKANDTTTKKILVGLLVLTCIALVAVSIGAGLAGQGSKDSGDDAYVDEDDIVTYCTSTDCLELAADISATLNTSVDPCDDFYHYVCDGWSNEASWNEINYPQYGQFFDVMEKEKEAYLDAMFYKTKASLVDHSSVEKAQAYFTTCLDSSVDMEYLAGNPFWQTLVNHTSFVGSDSGSDSWTSEEQAAFHDTMVFLTKMGYNSIFKMEPAGVKQPLFYQWFELWQWYDEVNGSWVILDIFPEWYMEYLEVDYETAMEKAKKAAHFADELSRISTVLDYEYFQEDTLMGMLTVGEFSDLSQWDTEYLSYTNLVLDVYGIKNQDDYPTQFQYLSGGVSYFESLSGVIESFEPSTVQAYILSSILYYYMDFSETYSQSRYEDRTDFCYGRTKDAFPYVYGYILYNTVYDEATETLASSMASNIKDNGVQTEIDDSSWLDDDSRAAAVKKIESMALYIGFPDRIKDGDNIDRYYQHVKQSAETTWMTNLQDMAEADYITQNESFWGNGYNLTAGWPNFFADPSSFDSWLTGINAFYYPTENFFTIPVTISQPPFLDGDDDYPSSVQYGGLGVVCGHEMSHGFDPSGSQYDYEGNYVDSIYTEGSQESYQKNMDCLIEQYNKIQVDTLEDGRKIYADGNQTITENVADNAGMASSWAAWQNHLENNGNDRSLYGIDLTQEQLYFVGYARLWCQSARPGSYANWTDVHAPNYARVIGPLQNSEHFAEAFGCATGSFMNPSTKCSVW